MSKLRSGSTPLPAVAFSFAALPFAALPFVASPFAAFPFAAFDFASGFVFAAALPLPF
jgi:hypothetical protein